MRLKIIDGYRFQYLKAIFFRLKHIPPSIFREHSLQDTQFLFFYKEKHTVFFISSSGRMIVLYLCAQLAVL